MKARDKKRFIEKCFVEKDIFLQKRLSVKTMVDQSLVPCLPYKYFKHGSKLMETLTPRE